jgi:hypothetical protein
MHDMQGDPIVFGFGLGGLRHKDWTLSWITSVSKSSKISRVAPFFSSRRAAGPFRKALS